MNNLLPGLAQRLAALTRDSVQSTGPIAAIAEQLPDFQPGERYTARILQNLRDGLMRADIGGQNVTLRLPQSVPEGQTVTLTHVARNAQTLVATLDGDGAPAADAEAADVPDAPVRLSTPARTIATLLEEPPPSPVRLPQGRPMLEPAQMLTPGGEVADAEVTPQIASRLAQAISDSGLFYESHQADWVNGRRPLESMAAEPQRALDPARTRPAPAQADAPERPAMLPAGSGPAEPEPATTAAKPASDDTALLRTDASPRERGDAGRSDAPLPSELRPLVHNQLLGLSQQTLAWEGLAWPGQTMRMEIDDPEAGHRSSAEDGDGTTPEVPWTTRVRMVLPGLGEVETSLTLWKDHGVTLAISADENARLHMASGLIELQQRMSDAGLRLGSVNFARMLDEAITAAAADASS